jgi:hypothetical protein
MEDGCNSDLGGVAPTTERAERAELDVQIVGEAERAWFDQQLAGGHYLGAGRAVGDYLRQRVSVGSRPVALLAWGPACYALKDRDRWVGWNATQRTERLKLIVQNRRFLLLTAKGQAPNLASQVLAAALRALPRHWQQSFGYRPLLAETFTDPAVYAGTCYKASNWRPLGLSAGHSRDRGARYLAHGQAKLVWVYPLAPEASLHLRSAQLPADCEAAVMAAPSGVLPLNQSQLLSLYECLRRVPDPRASNRRLGIGAVLTLAVLGWLAGRRELAELARFATTLHPQQRRPLGLPRRGTGACYEVPPYGVFSSVLKRVDAEAFALAFDEWAQARADLVRGALGLDGNLIRGHLRRLAPGGNAPLD